MTSDASAHAEAQLRDVAWWRRTGPAYSLLVTLLALVAALAIGALIIVLSDRDILAMWGYVFDRPTDAFRASWDAVWDAYVALFRGAVGGPRAWSETVVAATPLVLAGLGVTLAFRAGLFNIGGEGQLLVGGIAAAAAGFALDLPIVIHVTIAVAAGAAGGAMWGALPGWLKARTGAHEVITTIMLNYVAFNVALMFLKSDWVRRPGRSDPISRIVDETARLAPFATGYRANVGFLIAIAATAGVWWLLHRSTIGFEFRAVGQNDAAARTAGMSVERTWTLAMLLGGALAGLGGAAQLLGVQLAMAPGFSAGIGFDAITVALLGRGTPIGTFLAGLLFGALRAGGLAMQASTGTPIDLIVVVQALIILFIAAPALVRAMFRLPVPSTDRVSGESVAKGWTG